MMIIIVHVCVEVMPIVEYAREPETLENYQVWRLEWYKEKRETNRLMHSQTL